MYVNAKIEVEDLVESLQTQKDSMDLILAIDLANQCSDFTEELIQKLWVSLLDDLTKDQAAAMLAGLAKIMTRVHGSASV